jgi:hypothetical protein
MSSGYTPNTSIDTETQYFAAMDAKDAVATLKQRASDWYDTMLTNNYLDKVRRSWLAYYGNFYGDLGGGHTITFGGEQGEIAQIGVNHYQNIAKHIHVMVTANRPAFQARATNSDAKSLIQATLANQLLEYYMREKKLDKSLKDAVEQAVVLGSGYIKMEWNSELGEEYDVDDEGEPLRQGDVVITNLSTYDIVFDSSKETTDMDWVITRTWKNKFDIAAKYPEFADDINGLATKDSMSKYRLVGAMYDKTTDVPVYEFYHKPTESMPEGRYLMYLDDDTVLVDVPLPYRNLPVYRISPADIMGTPFGYTTMFDLLPLQDALNTLHSIILTNQNAFGIQNILIPETSNIHYEQLSGALNAISYNPMPNVPGGGKPEALQLTSTPAEIFSHLEKLERDMETISGVNSVARGNPEASLKSGNALALVQSQALQFISGLQQQYVQLIEDVGIGLIHMLQDFADSERMVTIVGKNNRTEMKEFNGDDLNLVSRVHVDVGNPLAQTTAGRVQMAEQMLQMFGDKMSPQQYISVMNTGKLDAMTAGIHDQNVLISTEGEHLASGEVPVVAIFTDDHAQHIQEHRNVLSDSLLRQDPELVKRVSDHIQEHITLLRETDADTLVMLQQQPLGPAAGSALSPENAPQGGANQEGMGGPQAQPSNEAAAQFGAQGGQMPSPALPAQSPDGGPVLPTEMPLGG